MHVRRVMFHFLVVMATGVWMTSSQQMDDKSGQPGKADASHKTSQLRYLVTEEVYFDIRIANNSHFGVDEPVTGRLVIACFGDIVPITCLNFQALAKGYRKGNQLLTYKNTPVHKIIRDFTIQMGDVTDKMGKGGISIYGKVFQDENFILSHRGVGWAAMANYGRDTNGSQFFILLQPTRWLDGKHVVFGKIIKGMDIIRRLAQLPTYITGRPKVDVTIVDCGVVGIPARYEIPFDDVIADKDIQ